MYKAKLKLEPHSPLPSAQKQDYPKIFSYNTKGKLNNLMSAHKKATIGITS